MAVQLTWEMIGACLGIFSAASGLLLYIVKAEARKSQEHISKSLNDVMIELAKLSSLPEKFDQLDAKVDRLDQSNAATEVRFKYLEAGKGKGH